MTNARYATGLIFDIYHISKETGLSEFTAEGRGVVLKNLNILTHRRISRAISRDINLACYYRRKKHEL